MIRSKQSSRIYFEKHDHGDAVLLFHDDNGEPIDNEFYATSIWINEKKKAAQAKIVWEKIYDNSISGDKSLKHFEFVGSRRSNISQSYVYNLFTYWPDYDLLSVETSPLAVNANISVIDNYDSPFYIRSNVYSLMNRYHVLISKTGVRHTCFYPEDYVGKQFTGEIRCVVAKNGYFFGNRQFLIYVKTNNNLDFIKWYKFDETKMNFMFGEVDQPYNIGGTFWRAADDYLISFYADSERRIEDGGNYSHYERTYDIRILKYDGTVCKSLGKVSFDGDFHDLYDQVTRVANYNNKLYFFLFKKIYSENNIVGGITFVCNIDPVNESLGVRINSDSTFSYALLDASLSVNNSNIVTIKKSNNQFIIYFVYDYIESNRIYQKLFILSTNNFVSYNRIDLPQAIIIRGEDSEANPITVRIYFDDRYANDPAGNDFNMHARNLLESNRSNVIDFENSEKAYGLDQLYFFTKGSSGDIGSENYMIYFNNPIFYLSSSCYCKFMFTNDADHGVLPKNYIQDYLHGRIQDE